jgi:nucleoside-diphosphate-sugar epimerase
MAAVSSPLIILGCGYIGSRLARAALAAGRPVRVCARSTGRLAPLGELGAQVKYVDAAVVKNLGHAMASMDGATVVYSIPPVPQLPPGYAMRAALQAAAGGGIGCFIHLSSSGLYGIDPDDETWVDEDTPTAHDDPPMGGVNTDEASIDGSTFGSLRTVILRLAPVYGPGRGVRTRLRAGTYKIIDEGQHVVSRVHVDDVVGAIFAAEQHAPTGSRILVADDEPTTQLEYATFLCERMGLPLPPAKPLYGAGAPRVPYRNRRIRNARMKQVLGYQLKYPSYREGEAAIDAEEQPAPDPEAQ